MPHKLVTRSLLLATGLSIAGSPLLTAAAAAQSRPAPQDQGYAPDQSAAPDQDDQDQGDPRDQGYPPPQGYQAPPPGYRQAPQNDGYGAPAGAPGYGNVPPPAYDQTRPPPGYAGNPAPPPPQGYDGSQPPPPPPGYQPDPEAVRQQAQDQQYAAYAQQWAQAYCVKAHGDAGAGAVIGGIAGALLGSSVAGRGSRGAGAIIGGGVGAVGGAAIADSSGSNATSPGCPPGFVTRSGAPPFAYGGYGGEPYVYAAPDWYRPWVYYGGAWVYRPYPYHVWYYGHYGRPYYGRPNYRYHRHW
jgi:hypothetical protein